MHWLFGVTPDAQCAKISAAVVVFDAIEMMRM